MAVDRRRPGHGLPGPTERARRAEGGPPPRVAGRDGARRPRPRALAGRSCGRTATRRATTTCSPWPTTPRGSASAPPAIWLESPRFCGRFVTHVCHRTPTERDSSRAVTPRRQDEVHLPRDSFTAGGPMSIAPTAELAVLAEHQHGVLHRDQLHELGLTDRQVRYRTREGLLVPFLGDTFRIAGAPPTALTGYRAATLGDPSSVLGFEPAAHLHRSAEFGPASPVVLTDRHSHHEVAGIAVRRRGDLLDRPPHGRRGDPRDHGSPDAPRPRCTPSLARRGVAGRRSGG